MDCFFFCGPKFKFRCLFFFFRHVKPIYSKSLLLCTTRTAVLLPATYVPTDEYTRATMSSNRRAGHMLQQESRRATRLSPRHGPIRSNPPGENVFLPFHLLSRM